MTRSVAANCKAQLKVENSIGFHRPSPPHEKLSSVARDSAEVLFRPSLDTQRATRRPPTGAIPPLRGGGRLAELSASLQTLPRSLSRALGCPPPSPPASPRLCPGVVCKGSWEPLEAPRTGIWEGMARGRGFPSNLRQVWLRESFTKFPAASAQVASAGRADGGERASFAAASAELWARSLAGSGPGSRRAGPPPGAKAAADAGGSEGGSHPPQLPGPHHGAYTWGLPGHPGRAPRGRSGGGTPGGSEPRAPPRPPRVLPSSWHEVPRAVVCVWEPPRRPSHPVHPAAPQLLQSSSPPHQPGGKGRARFRTRPS